MAYVLYCLDKPDSLAVRMATREAHLAYMAGFAEKRILVGPLLDEAGAMCGSLLIMNFATRAEAEAMAAGDPYAKAGLFQSVEIRPFKKVFPAE
ncbi:MAG: hypothetical protein A2516_08905 [Alphaproteobacteria bacterium RIFOXYD12_FULL_60_8]|nr:MAG: hypothetical protein A2516_08905 [Alphaproteobacteria bacterium RIFOXYD12_FULL_60_8]